MELKLLKMIFYIPKNFEIKKFKFFLNKTFLLTNNNFHLFFSLKKQQINFPKKLKIFKKNIYTYFHKTYKKLFYFLLNNLNLTQF
jgi:hypothetical protein